MNPASPPLTADAMENAGLSTDVGFTAASLLSNTATFFPRLLHAASRIGRFSPCKVANGVSKVAQIRWQTFPDLSGT